MRPLPRHDHQVRRSAACWLLILAPILWTADLLINEWGKHHPVVVDRFDRNGQHHTIHESPPWISLVRVAIPWGALLLLCLTRRIAREDAGLTFGQPATTFFWVGFPLLLAGLLALVFIPLGLLAQRLFDLKVPVMFLQPISVYRPEILGRQILSWCVLAPLIEEPLYRGMVVPSLERLGGRWLALAGGGVVWAALHYIYGWEAFTIPFYFFFWGVLVSWVYLQTHSLVTTLLLHGLFNFVSPIMTDLFQLHYPGLLQRWLFGG